VRWVDLLGMLPCRLDLRHQHGHLFAELTAVSNRRT
jgi:hypothetical protein